MRDTATPNGTDEGTQALAPTLNGSNKAWQFIRRPGAAAEDLMTQRAKDSQTFKDPRKGVKRNKNVGILFGKHSTGALLLQKYLP